jgi:hypothetical protein
MPRHVSERGVCLDRLIGPLYTSVSDDVCREPDSVSSGYFRVHEHQNGKLFVSTNIDVRDSYRRYCIVDTLAVVELDTTSFDPCPFAQLSISE